MLKNNAHFHQGMVLIIGLIFLMVLTIIGIAAMTSTALTEKMTQNFRDASSAFEAAEAALGDGEYWVQRQGAIPSPVASCTTPPCVWTYNSFGSFWQQPDSWWQANAVPFSSTLSGVSLQPSYVIEQYSFVPYELSPDALSTGHGYYFYRVTARGSGPTSTSHAVVQSIFVTQYN
jgi:type IV pilus assembly protein PilX